MRTIDADSVIDLFGISDRDIYAKEAIEEALHDGTLEIIEPERKKGEWKLNGMMYYCSECGHYYEQDGNNFCGHCGADMRGEQNGND